jgi:hypothetical protein
MIFLNLIISSFPTRPKFWQNRIMARINCYCAFCKSPRKVYNKRNINLFNIGACAFGSAILMFAIFQGFDPRIFILFVTFLAFSEMFIQIRWRLNMVCKYCGFDPVIYLKDPNRASIKVQAHLEKRKNDPATLLAKPLNIPKISKERKEVAIQESSKSPDKKGSLLSKQI